ncbi:uncharacterized protein [Nerophis lumbriciformis]|uniref:uncharacterized protein isoform X2 n=1 Tax=Nerophis lumbriciformis TaxID=546530 RepID=UPI002AE02647|nr:uncharacterized protein LOC133619051 isoform X2 [Nerophis lumbriciformis]
MKQPQPPHLKEDEEVPWCPNTKEEEEEPHLPHIKEEQEERCISQEGERFEGLDEFPVICVIVKNEEEIKGESEEREVEPQSSSSTQHMTREADGDHCEGTQANNLLAPLSESEDTTSHSSDTDDENSKAELTQFWCLKGRIVSIPGCGLWTNTILTGGGEAWHSNYTFN